MGTARWAPCCVYCWSLVWFLMYGLFLCTSCILRPESNISTSYCDGITAGGIHTASQAATQPPLMPCTEENRFLGVPAVYCWGPCTYFNARTLMGPECNVYLRSLQQQRLQQVAVHNRHADRMIDIYSSLCCHTELATPRRVAKAQGDSNLEARARGSAPRLCGRKRRRSSPDAARCHLSVECWFSFHAFFDSF